MQLLFFLILIAVGVLFLVNEGAAKALSLSGDWQYRSAKDEDENFQENYTASFSKRFTINKANSWNGSFRYYRNKDKTDRQETYTPSLGYTLTNYLFSLSVYGTATERTNTSGPDTSSRNWNSDWSSQWETSAFIPSVHLSAGQSWQFDDQNPKTSDSQNRYGNTSLSWKLKDSKLLYSYNWNTSENKVANTEIENAKHSGRFDTRRSFLQNRGLFQLALQYDYSTQENTVNESANGVALLERQINQSLTRVYDPPFQGGSPQTVTLSNEPGLINGSTTDAALVFSPPVFNTPGTRLDIGIRTNFETVDEVHLYTQAELDAIDSNSFGFAVYTSSNGTDWTLTRSNAAFTYDTINKRFEITTGRTEEAYLKIAITNSPAVTIVTFSEIQAFQEVPATMTTTIESDNTRYTSDMGLSLTIRKDLQFSSNLSYEKNERSSGSNIDTLNVSGGLFWKPRPEFSSSFSSNYNERKRSNSETTTDRSLGLQVSYLPLPSINTNFGTTYSETLEGGTKTQTTQSFNFNSVANLYTDLFSNLNIIYSNSKNKVSDTESKSLNSNLTLTARLIPTLLLDWKGNATIPSGGSNSYTSSINGNWRPTSMFALRSSLNQAWLEDADSSNFTLGVNLSPTRKTLMSLDYRHTIEPDSKQDYSSNIIWNINKNISWQFTGSYTMEEPTDSWSFSSRVNARASLL